MNIISPRSSSLKSMSNNQRVGDRPSQAIEARD